MISARFMPERKYGSEYVNSKLLCVFPLPPLNKIGSCEYVIVERRIVAETIAMSV